jgi:hypothetical protein
MFYHSHQPLFTYLPRRACRSPPWRTRPPSAPSPRATPRSRRCACPSPRERSDNSSCRSASPLHRSKTRRRARAPGPRSLEEDGRWRDDGRVAGGGRPLEDELARAPARRRSERESGLRSPIQKGESLEKEGDKYGPRSLEEDGRWRDDGRVAGGGRPGGRARPSSSSLVVGGASEQAACDLLSRGGCHQACLPGHRGTRGPHDDNTTLFELEVLDAVGARMATHEYEPRGANEERAQTVPDGAWRKAKGKVCPRGAAQVAGAARASARCRGLGCAPAAPALAWFAAERGQQEAGRQAGRKRQARARKDGGAARAGEPAGA